jgi:hypothetical protein
VASYKSSKFFILLGSSDEDTNGDVDDDLGIGVFLLLNIGNLCIGVYHSSVGNIGPSASIVGTSTSSSRIRSVLIHLTYS